MTDQEIADVTDYVRTAWSNAAPVIQKTGLVADIRAKMVSGLCGAGRAGREQRPLPDRTEFDAGSLDRRPADQQDTRRHQPRVDANRRSPR